MERILVVDDDDLMRESVVDSLEMDNVEILACNTGEAALEAIERGTFDVVITDIHLPGVDGIHVLRHALEVSPQTIVIMMTGQASLDTAIEALRLGATDYLRKPFNLAEIPIIMQRALTHKRLERENLYLKSELQKVTGREKIIGKSDSMQSVFELIDLVATTDSTVLIQGESGTGKELVARAIHESSRRKDGPLISFNTAAVPETLLEDELFGHEKGAFSGAQSIRQGRFERAHEGTLFLDEIGLMSPALQSKLLRVLQEREFERIGGTRTIKVDVRIIAATSDNLEVAISEKRFRQDLYYRLNVVRIDLPPLRERKADIPLLVDHFLRHLSKKAGLNRKPIAPQVLQKMLSFHWPGNIRQLEHAIERAMILSGSRETIQAADFPDLLTDNAAAGTALSVSLPPEGLDLNKTVEELEARYIQQALELSGGVRSQAANLLSLNRTTLIAKIKKNCFLS